MISGQRSYALGNLAGAYAQFNLALATEFRDNWESYLTGDAVRTSAQMGLLASAIASGSTDSALAIVRTMDDRGDMSAVPKLTMEVERLVRAPPRLAALATPIFRSNAQPIFAVPPPQRDSYLDYAYLQSLGEQTFEASLVASGIATAEDASVTRSPCRSHLARPSHQAISVPEASGIPPHQAHQ